MESGASFARESVGAVLSANMTNPPISQFLTAYIWRSPLLRIFCSGTSRPSLSGTSPEEEGPDISSLGGEKFEGRAAILVVLILSPGFVVAVDVSVKHRKSDKECHTDQVFNRFNILVVINQREYLLHFTNRS
jgi:hypothetical protein